jgi:hypothetical protein
VFMPESKRTTTPDKADQSLKKRTDFSDLHNS